MLLNLLNITGSIVINIFLKDGALHKQFHYTRVVGTTTYNGLNNLLLQL